MLIKNKLDKPFGPAGASTGIILFIVGVVTTWFTLVGLVLVVPGAFIGFTSTGTLIDTEKKRIKFLNMLFGFIPYGKWMQIEPGMKIGLKKSHMGYSIATKGNSRDIHINDIRISLYSSANKQIMHISKFNSIDAAKKELEKLSIQLGLGVIGS